MVREIGAYAEQRDRSPRWASLWGNWSSASQALPAYAQKVLMRRPGMSQRVGGVKIKAKCRGGRMGCLLSYVVIRCKYTGQHPVQEKTNLWVHPREKQQKGFKNCALRFKSSAFHPWVRCAEPFFFSFFQGWTHRVDFSCTVWPGNYNPECTK